MLGERQEVWGKVSEYLGADSTTRSFQNPYWCPSAPLLRLGFFHFPENWSIVFWRTWWSGSGTPGRCSYWSGGADEGFMGRKTCGAKTGSGRGTNGEACAEEGTDREGTQAGSEWGRGRLSTSTEQLGMQTRCKAACR